MVENSSLSKLLDESRKLASHVGTSNIPMVERNLDTLSAESRNLATKSNRSLAPLDSKTRAFFAEGGVDPGELMEKSNSALIDSINIQTQQTFNTNVENYISGQYENCIANAIDNSQIMALEDFDTSMEFNIQQAWEETKKKVFDGMGQPIVPMEYDVFDSSKGSSLGVQTYERGFSDEASGNSKFLGAKGIVQANPRVEKYTKVIRTLNNNRINKIPTNLSFEFSSATQQTTTLTGDKQLSKCWELLETITGKDSAQPVGKIDLTSGNASSAEKRQELVDRSRKFLENSYLQYIDRIIEQNPREASIGGIPSIHNKIRGFLQVKFSKSSNIPEYIEVYDNEAVWAHMYYLVRCGKLEEMLDYALGIEDVLADSDPSFISYLRHYIESPNRTLDASSQERISASVGMMRVNMRVVDPYKFSVYKVIGRCDLARKTVHEVIQTTEDYIWHQVC
ncbi:hypothetical protein BB559_003412 [Furculomyces boomerangus]|uniref:Nuclear pore protein n=2 Tax=Harpellales TaxID=61421 RepID=A0A2T9YLD0_9FUNG|nr:hypothetical protein BB559_003412 [Furculomyces boomerangus]PVZ99462.1 hypothetical protein BB558_004418 [Smittium angustum]